MERRQFLEQVAGVVAGLAIAPAAALTTLPKDERVVSVGLEQEGSFGVDILGCLDEQVVIGIIGATH